MIPLRFTQIITTVDCVGMRLRLLLCFGVIVFISLVSPLTAKAHSSDMGGREEGKVYEGTNPWDSTYVDWFTHDKKVGDKAVAKWYTKGYYVTTYPLLDYTIPAGVLQATEITIAGLPSSACASGYVDTAHLFDKWVITDWCFKSGASIADDGTMTVYAQPVIGTKTKKKGDWVDDGKTIMSLTDWVNVKKWTNTSTFSSHYNKPLHVVFPPTSPSQYTQVQYQALNDGEGYSAGRQLRDGAAYAFNLGSVHAYNEAGLMSYFDTVINGETRCFVLAGVRVDKLEGCVVGTSGRLAVSTEEDNLVVPAGSYATIDASLSDVGAIPGSGWTFRRDYSSVHSYVNGCNFRVSTGTTITYLYAEVKTVCKLYTAMRFDGYNTFNVMNAESPYRVNAFQLTEL